MKVVARFRLSYLPHTTIDNSRKPSILNTPTPTHCHPPLVEGTKTSPTSLINIRRVQPQRIKQREGVDNPTLPCQTTWRHKKLKACASNGTRVLRTECRHVNNAKAQEALHPHAERYEGTANRTPMFRTAGRYSNPITHKSNDTGEPNARNDTKVWQAQHQKVE